MQCCEGSRESMDQGSMALRSATPPPLCNPGPTAFSSSKSISPQRRQRCINEVETVLSRSLRQENELLRCQLDEVITRETNQRVELQRLSHQRDAQVALTVQTATAQLKAEVEQLKSMLQSSSSQLLQVLAETEQAKNQKDEIEGALEEAKLSATAHENQLKQRLQSFEQVLDSAVISVATLVDTVEGFQRHVLPTFKSSGFENSYKTPLKGTHDVADGKALMEQLVKLESGLTLLRVLVDAKNDTLVLIRGKLKQENEELRADLQLAKEAAQPQEQTPKATNPTNDGAITDNNTLRQELRELQSLFNEEVKQLKSKLKVYESEEHQGQGRLTEVQRELTTLREKLSTVEASKALLETSLKEETSARSQLVSQLVTLRKENEKMLAELETLKLSQKFLVRQPRGGQIPVEKMDLMNTVNQLLAEMNKLKGEKVSLEEELKSQRRSQVQERTKRVVTARDVEMAATSKVGDTELVSKLARARLQQLGLEEIS